MVYSATRTKAGSSQHDLLMDVTKSGAADAVCETVRSELVYGKDGRCLVFIPISANLAPLFCFFLSSRYPS